MLPGFVSAQTTLVSGTTVSITLTQGDSFSQNYIGSGTLNNSYKISGSLPLGLSSATGLPPASTFNTMISFSGTVTTAGTYVFDVTVTPTDFSVSPPPYTTTFSITVLPLPPVANPLSVSVAANTSANTLSPGITGSATSLTISTAPTHGVATVSGLGLKYTPATNYIGTDTLSYIAVGPGGSSSPATVSITVVAAPPTTANLIFQVNSGANPITATIAGTASSLALSVLPLHGTASISGLTLSYTPTTNYIGADTFTYTAIGASGVFASSTVAINVVAAAPTTASTNLTITSGSSASIDLASLVSGPTFTGLTVAISAAPAHGSATLSGTVLTYTPARSYTGIDTLSYIATAIGGSSAATISITIAARPDPSKDTGVIAMQAAVAATVRHFERTQLDNFNGRLIELASNAPNKTKANKQCGEVSMWAAGLNGLGSYNGPNGFDYNNSGTSIGGDRCFGNGSTVAGFGIGYGSEHSKLNLDGSVMRATAATGAAYGSVQLIPSMRFSWVAGVNQIDSNFDRYITLNKSFGHGKWSGKQYLSSGSVSHDFKFDQFFFVPFFKLDLSRLTLDPYAETGGGAYGLRYQAQTMSSQRTTLGFNGEYTLETSFGELTPRMRIEYQRDSARRNPLQVSYADGTDDLTYVIPADELDRHALLGSMGAELVLKNGVIVILNYAYSGANGGNKASGLQLRLSYKF
jgi:uncharacterized protein YhjY with autotransporter beta-barrel domain